MYFIYYFTQKQFPPICTAENALSDRRGEAGKGGRWAKGAINDILIGFLIRPYDVNMSID